MNHLANRTLTPLTLALCAVIALVLPPVSQVRNNLPVATRKPATTPNSAALNLTGEKATHHLKQQGLYDSLAAAVDATRYKIEWQEQTTLLGRKDV